MLGNLLDNACKWARRTGAGVGGARCRRHAAAAAGSTTTAPASMPRSASRALARGERLDQSAPGNGLGLAIVHDRVRLYGGTMVLDDAPHGGLRVVLKLPGALL